MFITGHRVEVVCFHAPSVAAHMVKLDAALDRTILADVGSLVVLVRHPINRGHTWIPVTIQRRRWNAGGHFTAGAGWTPALRAI
jgi:hypothetical protein